MSGPHTIPLDGPAPDYPKPFDNDSVGGDNNKGQTGNVSRIHIDFGKMANPIFYCAAFVGICAAVTIGTVWHSKTWETETQYRVRILQNHVDENTNELKRLCDKLGDEKCRQRIKEYEHAAR